jgi:hypothetical protein
MSVFGEGSYPVVGVVVVMNSESWGETRARRVNLACRHLVYCTSAVHCLGGVETTIHLLGFREEGQLPSWACLLPSFNAPAPSDASRSHYGEEHFTLCGLGQARTVDCRRGG